VALHQKLGAALVRLGRAEEGRRHLELAIRKYEERAGLGEVEAATQYYVAAAYALLDNLELAAKVLEKSITKQKWNQPRAIRDPDFQPLWPAIEAMDAGGALEGPSSRTRSTIRPTRLSDRARGRRTSAARAR
jgi:tetratricopeptide (TPR) repeat protein